MCGIIQKIESERKRNTACENNIGAPKMQNNYGAIKLVIFFSIAPHIVINFPTLQQQKLAVVISLLHSFNLFLLFGQYLLYCSSYSYRSFNYCDVFISYRSFLLV